MNSLNRISSRGSTLVVAIILTTAVALVTYSLISLAVADHRLDRDQKMRLDSKYAAESVLEYVGEQARIRFRNTSSLASAVLLNDFSLPPSSVFAGTHVDADTADAGSALAFKCYYRPVNANIFIDPNQPENAGDPLRGMTVRGSLLTIVSRGNARDRGTGRITTAHAYQEIQILNIPLFSYAIFYNPLMELSAGAAFDIVGPVHSNRSLVFDPYQSSSIFSFYSRLSTAGTLQLGDQRVTGDSDWATLAQRLRIRPAAGGALKTFTDLYATKPFGIGVNDNYLLDNLTDFVARSSDLWGGNLETKSHGVQPVLLPGMGDYEETASGANESHQLIERGGSAALVEAMPESTPEEQEAKAKARATEAQKYANMAGLYIEVDYTGSGSATAYRFVANATGDVYRTDPITGSLVRCSREAVTLPAGVVTFQTNVGSAASNTFFDARRNRWVKMANINMGALKTAVDSGTPFGATYNLANDWNGVVYVAATQAPADTANYPSTGLSGGTWGTGVRLYNGANLPSHGANAGLTVATNTAMYVQGNYNADGANIGNPTVLRAPDNDAGRPAALIADAITVLSNDWQDTRSKGGYNNRAASSTEIGAAILTGIVPSGTLGDLESGGANNLVRLLEQWSPGGTRRTLAIRGSNVVLFKSTVANAPFVGPGGSPTAYNKTFPDGTFNSASRIGVYNAGNRSWVFSQMFEDGTFPPGTPWGRAFRRTSYRETTGAYFASFSTTTPTAAPDYPRTLARPLP